MTHTCPPIPTTTPPPLSTITIMQPCAQQPRHHTISQLQATATLSIYALGISLAICSIVIFLKTTHQR